jgi:hypothetical protein
MTHNKILTQISLSEGGFGEQYGVNNERKKVPDTGNVRAVPEVGEKG